jgi:hypothetical protein
MLGKYCLRLFFGVGVFFYFFKNNSFCVLFEYENYMDVIYEFDVSWGHLQVFVGLIALFLVDDGDELTILLTTV